MQRSSPQNKHEAQCTDEKGTLQRRLFEESGKPEISLLLPVGIWETTFFGYESGVTPQCPFPTG